MISTAVFLDNWIPFIQLSLAVFIRRSWWDTLTNALVMGVLVSKFYLSRIVNAICTECIFAHDYHYTINKLCIMYPSRNIFLHILPLRIAEKLLYSIMVLDIFNFLRTQLLYTYFIHWNVSLAWTKLIKLIALTGRYLWGYWMWILLEFLSTTEYLSNCFLSAYGSSFEFYDWCYEHFNIIFSCG